MKNKPTRHKEENTFKFIPFSERVSNIDVDIFHRVAHEYETETEDECYFYQCIQKWNVLNLTEGYNAFKKEVQAYTIVTLPQLIHKKDHVTEVLIKHLKLKDVLYLQPLLELVVAVTKDLRKEFHAYYQDVLSVLVELLDTKDAEQLEWVFTCLAYMFKFLWRPLIKDIKNVFITLLPLLSDSRPTYINAFAAESFAFVARKIKDRKTFLEHMLAVVQEQEDGVSGCGKLLFEIIHGVEGQFHSCAEETLCFLLQSLNDKEYQHTLFEVLSQVVTNMASKIHHKNSTLFWTVIIAILKKLFDAEFNENTEKHVDLLLQLCGMALEYRDGKFLNSNSGFVESFIYLHVTKLSEPVLLTYCKVAVIILLSNNIKLSQENASALTKKMTNTDKEEIFLYFMDSVKNSDYKTLLLPSLLKFCYERRLSEKPFQILTKFILHNSPLCGSGINLKSWKKYRIDFGSVTANIEMIAVMEKSIASDDIYKDPTHALCSLICLPHLATPVSEIVKHKIKELVFMLCDSIQQKRETKLALFLLQNALESLVHLDDERKLVKECFEVLLGTLLPLATNVGHILSLKVLDLLLAALSDQADIIQMETLLRVNRVLEDQFCSPYHEIRLLTSHIYTLFENLPEFGGPSETEIPKVFSLCYDVESTNPQVHTFKDQLHFLEYLECGRKAADSCSETACKLVPLKYLCGALYINFRLLWEPTVKLVSSHAFGLTRDEFWGFFGAELKRAMENVRAEPQVAFEPLCTASDYFNEKYRDESEIKDKPDFFNYGVLLWKATEQFAGIVEEKNRIVVEIILDFIKNSGINQNTISALICNIKEKDVNDQGIAEQSPLDEEKAAVKAVVQRKGPKVKILLAQLSLLSKMKNPKALYKEPELNRLYFDLLSHKSPEIQKEAFNCIMTYKYNYLTPYQQNLLSLIDEKNFKRELTLFKVDDEGSAIQKEHREGLIPLVIQIVFAKMTRKIGLRTGGKSSAQQRRNIVLRFLAGCTAREMKLFIDKAFRIYCEFFQANAEINAEQLTNSIDLEKFFIPKRLLSSLHLLDLIFEHFGGLLEETLQRHLLQILLVMGCHVRKALEAPQLVHAGYLPPLRMARTVCLKILARFFELFEEFPWTANEINAIFEAFVWPYVEKLPAEGIHSPTALLKLFSQWSCVPKYFPLLVKKRNGDNYVLAHVIKLLLNSHCKNVVANVVMEMLEKLLTLQSSADEIGRIPVENLKPIEDDILNNLSLDENLNYGSCILLPLVPLVLQKIKSKLQTSKYVNQRELFILSRISELVWEAEASDSVLQIFLPIILKKCGSANEEVVNQQLSTVCNLLNNVANPERYLKEISPMFGAVSYISGRKILCQALEKIARKHEEFASSAQLVLKLNAWDQKWVDQPDYEKRLSALKEAQALMENASLPMELGILLIYNCYYFISKEADLSLRDHASHTLKTITPYLIKTYKSHTDYILSDVVFALIRSGFKSKQDEVRHECIALLGCVARECPDSHAVSQDLNKFSNKTDLEVDCFENLTHMQLHRHARALLKISQVLKEQVSAPSPRTLTQFVLPMATFYLCNEKYANKNSLVDAVIEVVSTVCRLLPWHQYEVLLKFYLGKLQRKSEHQRQLVRVVVGVLDAFHFDLGKGQAENLDGAVVLKQENDDGEVKTEGDRGDEALQENGGVEPEDEDGEVNEENEEEMDAEGLEESFGKPDDQEEVEAESVSEEIAAVNRSSVLCKSAAVRVIRTIEGVLLPQLKRALAEMTHFEGSHKVNRKKTGAQREEEDLVRVPISLALVKLLQKLPKRILDTNLPGIFMKACTFLKSHLESVRRVTRETLQSILIALGPGYLKVLLAEVVPLLNRGFQVHVLVYTIHAVLCCLKDKYEAGDVNEVLITVLQICKADLCGVTAEEKEVAKITRKISEAKSTKTFDTFKILAQFVTDNCLLDLLLPLKEILATSHSYKLINRAQECLRHVAIGLTENEFISVESFLKFAYGIASESIPELLKMTENGAVEKRRDASNPKSRTDCFILPENPGRAGAKPQGKLSSATNRHHLIEFALKLCHFLLKHEKVKDADHQVYLDPFIGIFKNCLLSRHVKLSTTALQCLCWAMKYDLPAVKEHVKEISEAIFSILHKYAAAGLSKGDNFDLVVAAFKAVTVLIRDVKCFNADKERLKVLLLYAEQDLHDPDRQATAFGLLRAIIARRLSSPELHATMEKVSELSVISELDHVRVQARLVCLQYVLEYPLGKKLNRFVAFYISQLSYELQSGRESALEMIQNFVNSFPVDTLKEHSGTFLVTLGARLVNEDVPECRKKAADCLKSMFTRLPQQDRDALFDIIVVWFKDKKINHRQMAAHLCGLFISVEKAAFASKIPALLSLVFAQFGLDEESKPGRFVLLPKETSAEDLERERAKDHHHFQVLQMLLKLCAHCPQFLNRAKEVEVLATHVQTLLAHPHEWVRLGAAQFLGFVVASLDVNHLSELIVKNSSDPEGYLNSDPRNAVESLTLDLCAQLQPGGIREEFAQQVIKILVFIARVLEKVPLESENEPTKLNFLWLTKRMRKIVNTEIVQAPTSGTLRGEVFKWIAGVSTVLGESSVKAVLHHLLAPLARELLTKEEGNAHLRGLAKDVCNLIRERVGLNFYSNALSKVQQQLSVKRAERKRVRTQLAVTDPEVYAMKKIKKHEKKKVSKKRKREERKGVKKTFKKRKVIDLENDEIM